jgi:hypothetical protein
VATVVVGDAFDVAEPHRKRGLGAFEGLDLALSVPPAASATSLWPKDACVHRSTSSGAPSDVRFASGISSIRISENHAIIML